MIRTELKRNELQWNAQTPPYLDRVSWRASYTLLDMDGGKQPKFSVSLQLDDAEIPEKVLNVLLLSSQIIHQKLPELYVVSNGAR